MGNADKQKEKGALSIFLNNEFLDRLLVLGECGCILPKATHKSVRIPAQTSLRFV